MLIASSNRGQFKSRVWDLPVRITHWLLVTCITIAWLTLDARLMDLHAAAGYCALLLAAFRLTWGIVGTRHARFSSFAYTPGDALRYLGEALRGTPRHFTGHNPAGSWSVYVLLAGIVLACSSGVVAIAGMFAMGPLAIEIPPQATDWVRRIHEWTAWTLLAVIFVHVSGAIWGSWVHRENFVAAMVTGKKLLHGADRGESPARAGIAATLLMALGLFLAFYLHASGWDQDYRQLRERVAAKAPTEDIWQRECGSCHLAYSPALLPQRSWERMLAEQARHFGEDLSLDDAAARAILASAAATPTRSWAAWKLASSPAPSESPQRITELRFWRHAHHDLRESAYRAPVSAGRHDCEACHRDAASVIFHPRMIQKPARGSKW